MRLFDSHCHLQDARLAPGLDEVMERGAAAGVDRLLCCGSAEEDWPAVFALSAQYPQVLPAFGLHPWYVRERGPDWLKALEGFLQMVSSAVGEIGLDHAIDPRNDAEQEEVFLAQIELSRKLERPVSIHCRRAYGRLMELLPQLAGHPRGFAIHSFSGSTELIDSFARAGAWFSFSGSITRPSNDRGREAARHVPADRLLVESDAPDIAPTLPDGSQPELSEPEHLPLVVKALAEARRTSADEIAALTWENACRLLGEA